MRSRSGKGGGRMENGGRSERLGVEMRGVEEKRVVELVVVRE